jgi:hypothetical protein
VRVAQGGWPHRVCYWKARFFGLRRATRDPEVGGAVLQTSVCSSRLKAELARTGGEPRSGGVLRGWWLGIHHFVVAPLAVCHPLKEIEYHGFDCVKHGFLCPRVLSLYQAHRRSMAGLFAKLTVPSTRWCGLMPLFLEQQRRRLPHVGQTRHERSSNQRSPTRRNFSETSLIIL